GVPSLRNDAELQRHPTELRTPAARLLLPSHVVDRAPHHLGHWSQANRARQRKLVNRKIGTEHSPALSDLSQTPLSTQGKLTALEGQLRRRLLLAGGFPR